MEDDSSAEVITLRIGAKTGRKPARKRRSVKDGWVKTLPSKQDIISRDKDAIEDKLKDWERIPESEYADIDTGTFIRYLKHDPKTGKEMIRLGGYLIKNGAPDYWVLKSGKKGSRPITWSVPLKRHPRYPKVKPNKYFRKKGIIHHKEARFMYGAEVYHELMKGSCQLLPAKEKEQFEEFKRQQAQAQALKETGEGEDEEANEPSVRYKVNFVGLSAEETEKT